ncbi:MAG: DUF192 domain-containing protein [Gammaproteobacteria bacterium]
MNHGKLANNSNDCLIENVFITSNFLDRMCGLLFRPQLKAGEALLISPCSSVHTFGMRYSIDLVYLDATMTVLKTVSAIRPWRMSACKGAKSVLELAANRAEELSLVKGQQLVLHEYE